MGEGVWWWVGQGWGGLLSRWMNGLVDGLGWAGGFGGVGCGVGGVGCGAMLGWVGGRGWGGFLFGWLGGVGHWWLGNWVVTWPVAWLAGTVVGIAGSSRPRH